jgi:hypothetical protein
MSRIIIRGFKRQLKSRTPRQLVHEPIQPWEQPLSQAKGIQLIDALNNEPQQPVMAYLPLYQIPTK